MGTLYLVATPIGNLEDITARALRILRECRLIAAEDTRHTRKLLSHYGIKTPLTSYHEHSRASKMTGLLQYLDEGDVALVSDAGTPGLNDPGYELVRAALEQGHAVSPIPGPSAPIAALVASGLPTHAFLYLGYLPRKSGERQRLLDEIVNLPFTLIFLETPHRLLSALKEMQETLGDRQSAIARELTKRYEEIFRGSLLQAIAHFSEQPPRGEFTLIIAGSPPQEKRWSRQRLQATLADALKDGMPSSQAASRLAADSGWSRRDVYRMITAHRRENHEP